MTQAASRFFGNPMTMLLLITLSVLGSLGDVFAQNKSEKSFSAVITDAHGIETEVKNVLFYWEEKISDTAFVRMRSSRFPSNADTRQSTRRRQ